MYMWVSIFALFVVFFFKQKTAYEMRISDWSSDVCSSDLQIQLCESPDGQYDAAHEAAGPARGRRTSMNRILPALAVDVLLAAPAALAAETAAPADRRPPPKAPPAMNTHQTKTNNTGLGANQPPLHTNPQPPANALLAKNKPE